MRMVVVRHAARERQIGPADEYGEKKFPLTPAGEQQAHELGRQLLGRQIIPNLYLTSCFVHSRQTADILRSVITPDLSPDILELCTLTPHFQGPRDKRGEWGTGIDILSAIQEESLATGNDLASVEVIAIVLHKPRLEQLLGGVMAQDQSRHRDLDYAEGVCVTATSLAALLQGKGQQEGPTIRR
jgi:Histidine phosphatase superfamily (branch 1)